MFTTLYTSTFPYNLTSDSILDLCSLMILMTRTTCAHHIKFITLVRIINIQDLFTFTFCSVNSLHPSFPSDRTIRGETFSLYLRYTSFTRHTIIIVNTQFHWIHAYILSYILTYMHPFTHNYLQTYVPTFLRTFLHTCIPTYIHAYMSTYILITCLHTNLHTCIPSCMDPLVSPYSSKRIHTFYLPTHQHTYI